MDHLEPLHVDDPRRLGRYELLVAKVADGGRSLSFAAVLIKQVELPDEYTDASAAAPQCQE